ncbi:hypothetical protein [Photobacterium leiognathi]|uniref:hypothetical protein n=1 Tax=Photobacterium leiognathi TaxID=553611 RepID=UPI002980EE11|nr:hypothetical protein [Photobacterium leiognathi]
MSGVGESIGVDKMNGQICKDDIVYKIFYFLFADIFETGKLGVILSDFGFISQNTKDGATSVNLSSPLIMILSAVGYLCIMLAIFIQGYSFTKLILHAQRHGQFLSGDRENKSHKLKLAIYMMLTPLLLFPVGSILLIQALIIIIGLISLKLGNMILSSFVYDLSSPVLLSDVKRISIWANGEKFASDLVESRLCNIRSQQASMTNAYNQLSKEDAKIEPKGTYKSELFILDFWTNKKETVGGFSDRIESCVNPSIVLTGHNSIAKHSSGYSFSNSQKCIDFNDNPTVRVKDVESGPFIYDSEKFGDSYSCGNVSFSFPDLSSGLVTVDKNKETELVAKVDSWVKNTTHGIEKIKGIALSELFSNKSNIEDYIRSSHESGDIPINNLDDSINSLSAAISNFVESKKDYLLDDSDGSMTGSREVSTTMLYSLHHIILLEMLGSESLSNKVDSDMSYWGGGIYDYNLLGDETILVDNSPMSVSKAASNTDSVISSLLQYYANYSALDFEKALCMTMFDSVADKIVFVESLNSQKNNGPDYPLHKFANPDIDNDIKTGTNPLSIPSWISAEALRASKHDFECIFLNSVGNFELNMDLPPGTKESLLKAGVDTAFGSDSKAYADSVSAKYVKDGRIKRDVLTAYYFIVTAAVMKSLANHLTHSADDTISKRMRQMGIGAFGSFLMHFSTVSSNSAKFFDMLNNTTSSNSMGGGKGSDYWIANELAESIGTQGFSKFNPNIIYGTGSNSNTVKTDLTIPNNEVSSNSDNESRFLAAFMEQLFSPMQYLKDIGGFDREKSFASSLEECAITGECVAPNKHPLTSMMAFGLELVNLSVWLLLIQRGTDLMVGGDDDNVDLGGIVSRIPALAVVEKIIGLILNLVHIILTFLLPFIYALLAAGIFFAYVVPLMPYTISILVVLGFFLNMFVLLIVAPLSVAIQTPNENGDFKIKETKVPALLVNHILTLPLLAVGLVVMWVLSSVGIYLLNATAFFAFDPSVLGQSGFSIQAIVGHVMYYISFVVVGFVIVKFSCDCITKLPETVYESLDAYVKTSEAVSAGSQAIENFFKTAMASGAIIGIHKEAQNSLKEKRRAKKDKTNTDFAILAQEHNKLKNNHKYSSELLDRYKEKFGDLE